MNFFKSITVLILAEQWLGTVDQKESLLADGGIMESAARDGSVLVPTLEGNLTCRLNDYITKDGNGCYSVVDAKMFESAYEVFPDAIDLEVVSENVGKTIPTNDAPGTEGIGGVKEDDAPEPVPVAKPKVKK